MTSDIDAALGRLSSQPTHPALSDIEDAVLTRVHQPRPTTAAYGVTACVAAAGAVLLGVVGAGTSAAPAAATSLAPLGPTLPLAPSTLLASDR